MFKKLAVAAVCVCVVSPCLAAHWYAFNSASSERQAAYFDKDTITKQGTTVTLWVKWIYNQDFVAPGEASSIVWKETYNCAKRTSQTLTTTGYDKDGRVFASSSKPGNADEAIPGTVGETLLGLVCEKGFPLKAEKRRYAPVDNNDAEEDAEFYFRWVKEEKAKDKKAAPGASAVE